MSTSHSSAMYMYSYASSPKTTQRSPMSRTASFVLFVALLSAHACIANASRMRSDADAGSADGNYTSAYTVPSGVYSIWNANDTCDEPESVGNCLIEITCNTCLTRPGCAIESTTGKCVSASRIDVSVGVEYFTSGETEYCPTTDSACTACSAPDAASDAVCRGKNGCVCVHRCEAAAIQILQCSGSHHSFNLFYIVIGAAFVVPALIMAAVYKGLTRNLTASISRVLSHERRRADHDAHPLTMKLDGWRDYMAKEIKEHPEQPDLKLCPVRASTEDAASLEEGRKTEDCDALSMSSPSASSHRFSLASPHEQLRYDCEGEESKDDHEHQYGYVHVTTPKGSTAAL